MKNTLDIQDMGRRIGRKMASHRVLLGLSVVQCAQEAGITRQMWGHWEREGARQLASLVVVARVLGITVSEIVSCLDEEPPLPRVAEDRIVEDVI